MRVSILRYWLPALLVGAALAAVLTSRGDGTVTAPRPTGFLVYGLPAADCSHQPPPALETPMSTSVLGRGNLVLNGHRLTLERLPAFWPILKARSLYSILLSFVAASTRISLTFSTTARFPYFPSHASSAREFLLNVEHCGYRWMTIEPCTESDGAWGSARAARFTTHTLKQRRLRSPPLARPDPLTRASCPSPSQSESGLGRTERT